jgi:hypothetical protein
MSDTDTDTDGEGTGMSSRAAMMQKSEQEDKSWLQRQKDKLADHKEKRAQRKAEERKQRAEQERQIRVGHLHIFLGHGLISVETSRGVQEEAGRASTRSICCPRLFSIRRSIHGIQIANGNGSRRSRSIVWLRYVSSFLSHHSLICRLWSTIWNGIRWIRWLRRIWRVR